VAFSDRADDAWGDGWATGSPTLSQKAFDILRVGWAPAPDGYSTSIILAGVASANGAYVSSGGFRAPDGEQCQLRHYLPPGGTAFTQAFCPSGQSERVSGGPVTSTPTADGGTVLAATFDRRAIPPSLQAAGGALLDLSASTCVATGTNDCNWADIIDGATSTLTYTI
jgi:hypothetical protein